MRHCCLERISGCPSCSQTTMRSSSTHNVEGRPNERTAAPKSESTASCCPIANFGSQCPKRSFSTSLYFYWLLLVATTTLFLGARAADVGAKCYTFAPGLTIQGADFRRDFGLSRRQCADVCKSDACCMAFEWRREGGVCTLKSRSLNGTVARAEEQIGEDGPFNNAKSSANDVLFALCLDYGDSERDRFWDHEMGGTVVVSVAGIEREKCAQLCGEYTAAESIVQKREIRQNLFELFGRQRRQRRNKRPNTKGPAVIYNWRTQNAMDMEAVLGECQCISVLQHIRLSFGSFSGFLV